MKRSISLLNIVLVLGLLVGGCATATVTEAPAEKPGEEPTEPPVTTTPVPPPDEPPAILTLDELFALLESGEYDGEEVTVEGFVGFFDPEIAFRLETDEEFMKYMAETSNSQFDHRQR